jgi:RNA 3'-terminal phosphate cyclase
MDTEKALKLAEKALETLIKTNPFLGPVAWALFDSAKDTETAIDTGEISKLETEARRQELSLHMAKMQAQVAQELAIAHRIENALEVEIEEYYEGTGKGGAGVSTDGVSASFSLGGEGRKVSKRVYRFKSKADPVEDL